MECQYNVVVEACQTARNRDQGGNEWVVTVTFTGSVEDLVLEMGEEGGEFYNLVEKVHHSGRLGRLHDARGCVEDNRKAELGKAVTHCNS